MLLWAGTGLNASIEVRARFEPSRVALGNAARYIIEITEKSVDALPSTEPLNSLPIPPANGITLRNGQTSSSQQTSIINGRAEYSITQRIIADAIPAGVGSFTIPGYTFDYKGTRLQVPAATLTVVERSANAGSTTDELIFLALKTPEELYVGQTKPVTLNLYVAENLSLQGYNSFEREADGFTILGGPPEESIKSMEIVNGRRYQVYSWPLQITPIRTGKQDLNFYFQLSVVAPNRRNTRGNSIFDNFFGRTERINVYTTPTQIEVLPLPTEGKPKSFSGAVGRFDIAVSADSKSTRVNEPIMLSLKLSGEGNFDRIQAPELPEAKGWRSYPPESVFETKSGNRLRGAKRFDYIFVPEKAGTLKLPEVSFSFFDPATEKYVELSSPAIAVEVAPSNMPSALPTARSGSENKTPANPSASLKRSLEPEEFLFTLDYRPVKNRNLPTGSIFTPSFYWLNGSLFAVLSIAVILSCRRRHLIKSPHYELVRNAREELKAAINKTGSNDATIFFSNALKAIRLKATIRTKSSLQNADFNTLEIHFRQTGVAEATIDLARNLFEAADAEQFSGQRRTTDLAKTREQLKTLLKALG